VRGLARARGSPCRHAGVPSALPDGRRGDRRSRESVRYLLRIGRSRGTLPSFGAPGNNGRGKGRGSSSSGSRGVKVQDFDCGPSMAMDRAPRRVLRSRHPLAAGPEGWSSGAAMPVHWLRSCQRDGGGSSRARRAGRGHQVLPNEPKAVYNTFTLNILRSDARQGIAAGSWGATGGVHPVRSGRRGPEFYRTNPVAKMAVAGGVLSAATRRRGRRGVEKRPAWRPLREGSRRGCTHAGNPRIARARREFRWRGERGVVIINQCWRALSRCRQKKVKNAAGFC